MAELGVWPRRLINTGHMAALAVVERRVPFWPLERIQQRQDRRLQSIVRHAYETVPYYRRTMDEIGLRPGDFQTVADLAKLPLLNDATVRQDPDQFASSSYDDRTRRTYLSSGSLSHVRKKIYWDDASILCTVARSERDRAVLAKLSGRVWRRRQLLIMPPTGIGVAIIGRTDAQTWARHLVRRYDLSAEEPFEALVARLNDVRPHVVISYGSYADHFFRYLADGDVGVALPCVWRYGGDTLSPGGRELIEGTFGCPVLSTYQTVEMGRIGFQCEQRQGFHLNIDLCAVRVVDGDGCDLPPGEDGEIVTSNLHNRAMVLLNQRLGDWGALAGKPCPCGRTLPLLERLHGRKSEAIALGDGRIVSSLTVNSIFRQELRTSFKSQIVHSAPGHIRWRIVPFAGIDRDDLRSAVIARGKEALGEDVRVEVEFVADIPPTPAGKYPLVVTAEEPR